MKFINGLELTDDQKEIVGTCINKKKACIAPEMGEGKTIISLSILMNLIEANRENKDENFQNVAIFVTSITLIPNVENEIKKFYGDSLKYQVVAKISDGFKPKEGIDLIITIPTVLSKCYENCNIKKFSTEVHSVQVSRYMNTDKVVYLLPKTPFLKDDSLPLSYFYRNKFSCFIVDEVQNYTNINTLRCQSIASICSDYRYLLSGTAFDEPKVEKILGFHVMLGDETFPKSIIDAQRYIRDENFPGLEKSMIKFKNKKVSSTSELEVNKVLIEHELTDEEAIIYFSMKKTLKDIQKQLNMYRAMGHKTESKKFSSYILTLLTYIRQGIVVPLIPIANVALDVADQENKSELSEILNGQFKKLGLEKWLSDPNSVRSSRISNIIKVINNHKEDKVVIFTIFRTSIDVIEYFIKEDEPDCTVFNIDSKMSVKKRADVIENFTNCKTRCVLLLTYELGATGLNLQFANTLLVVDFWWNIEKSNQAISRILRKGQTSKKVNIYFFTSNTGIEKSLFVKQQDKILVLDELKTGPMKSEIGTVSMNEVIKLLDKNENTQYVNKLYKIGKS